ncbi:hypothetical protein BDB01DRAFT_792455 [Pilobolus umbonatus]|nr:hypothetical protein BDB01DRAFT_792455 [Pilobolus umbonatus]
MIRHLHAFLCSFENDLQHYGYTCASALSQILDPHELAEHMMDELICISWNTDMSEHAFIQTSVQSVLYFELFGKALERMTDHRDWMLFLPFLANYVQRTWTCIESIIRDHSVFYCEDAPNFWNQAIILHASSVLDLIEFIHSRTVITSVSEFPIHTTDIGLENGDAKRRYLAYYLHMLLHEMVFLNVDMDLSKTYYDLYHPKYNIQRSKQGNRSSTKREHFPLLEVICRSANIASLHGMTFIRMCQLKRQLDENEKILGKDAHMFNDDSQIINSRLYPIDFHGIATLISMSMYDRYIYPAVFHCKSSHLMPTVLSSMWIGKEYTGIMLNLLLGSPELVCHIDKCIFFLLYLGDDIDTQFHFEDIEKKMKGPLGKENEFSSMKCIEILSSVASTCPNSSIRFLCFQLIKRALELGDDEVRVFCLMEFLDRCPYVSMKTAAISLLKDQIDRSYTQYDKEKIQSVFITPFVYDKFFKVIFNVKDTWMKSTSHAEFWDDYSYIMQGLNMYLFLLIRDKKHNLVMNSFSLS